jgi:hypothetical protein
MSTSTRTTTFNRSNARDVAGKLAADLQRLSDLYDGYPSEQKIEQIVEEVTEMLAGGYMKSLEIGYKRDGRRVLTLFYEARLDGTLSTNDNAGGIPRGVDISGCETVNFMSYSQKYFDLSSAEKEALKARLPYARTSGVAPSDGSGVWVQDRTYSSGGGGAVRKTFKPL